MFGLGNTEIVVIAVVAVVLFGAKRIPELAKSVGASLNAFKSGLKHGENDRDGREDPPRKEGVGSA